MNLEGSFATLLGCWVVHFVIGLSNPRKRTHAYEAIREKKISYFCISEQISDASVVGCREGVPLYNTVHTFARLRRYQEMIHHLAEGLTNYSKLVNRALAI